MKTEDRKILDLETLHKAFDYRVDQRYLRNIGNTVLDIFTVIGYLQSSSNLDIAIVCKDLREVKEYQIEFQKWLSDNQDQFSVFLVAKSDFLWKFAHFDDRIKNVHFLVASENTDRLRGYLIGREVQLVLSHRVEQEQGEDFYLKCL